MAEYRKEIPREQCRPDPTFNQKPTGHVIPTQHGYSRSADDPSMDFRVPDCGVKAGGQFSDPFFMDDRDLPTKQEDIQDKQGF
jgi:hypothetical protein